MEPNQLSDVRERLHNLRIQKGTIRDRTDSLTQELLKPTVDSKTAWDRACESGLEPTYETDTKAAIREELEMLEGRERFIDEAIEGGMTVADQLHGQASVKACQPKRAAVVAQIKRQLLALREVEKANVELQRIRTDIERDGFATGSLPSAIFDQGGKWNDCYGGRLVGHCRHIAEHYPELAELALSELD